MTRHWIELDGQRLVFEMQPEQNRRLARDLGPWLVTSKREGVGPFHALDLNDARELLRMPYAPRKASKRPKLPQPKLPNFLPQKEVKARPRPRRYAGSAGQTPLPGGLPTLGKGHRYRG